MFPGVTQPVRSRHVASWTKSVFLTRRANCASEALLLVTADWTSRLRGCWFRLISVLQMRFRCDCDASNQ